MSHMMNVRFPFPSGPWVVLLLSMVFARADNCFSCAQPLLYGHYTMQSTGFLDPQLVCKTCYDIKERCALCRLPSTKMTTLPDGRLLCRFHAGAAVLKDRDAIRIFESAKREVFPILNGLGKLPTRNVSVHLADANKMTMLRRQLGPAQAGYDTMGLTHSSRSPQGEWSHHIFLLTGLPESKLIAVMAHEYTHVWLNENLPEDRKVQVDTVEGFCELVSHKVTQQRRDALEQRVIQENAYSKGQVSLLLQAQDQHQFHRVVNWMLHGTEPAMTANNLNRISKETAAPARPAGPVPLPQAVATPVPDELTLKGISGVPGRYFALINDKTLTVNDTARVRVGQETVSVRCLKISSDSVTLQVKGQAEPVTLRLRTGT